MKTKCAWMCALTASLAVAGLAQAAQPARGNAMAVVAPTPFGVAPVGDAALSAACGGYDLGDGLLVSFGISRLVYVNGGLAAGISVNLPDLSHLDNAQANSLAALLDGVTLVRNGPGNFVDPVAFNRVSGAIVIQNSLDNQRIQAFTTLDIGVKDIKLFNALNLGNTLQSALINSRGQ
ncbi:MAG: hypothetical protein EPN36_01365 [Rhodanobacteraceae bacterium]|nr:MAG: hypothetical protein EPN36_01365 [Rhodanobacteraceae bacterium]